MSYKHLTPEMRETVVRGIESGKSCTEIAKGLGCNKSTVSREIMRNGGRDKYSGVKAQKRYKKRRKACHIQPKLLADPILLETVSDRLLRCWSPEQIANTITQELSAPTIYRAIKHGILLKGEGKSYLRCGGKPYRKRNIEERRGKIPGRVLIDERPAVANARARIGDFEGDTVIGRQGTGAILTMVDRKSRYLAAVKLSGKNAAELQEQMAELMSSVPCLSITLDNGKEFASHAEITEELGVPVYFAHPHSPWERGSNENTNKLLRQFLPKGTSFKRVTDDELGLYVKLLNDRPRKCLGYKTPADVFWGVNKSVALGLTI